MDVAADGHMDANDRLALPHEGVDLDIRRGLEHIGVPDHIDNVLHHRGGVSGVHAHDRSVVQHAKIDVAAEAVEKRAD